MEAINSLGTLEEAKLGAKKIRVKVDEFNSNQLESELFQAD